MKLRLGFVSNSSSSSFILAYKKSEPCVHCGRSDPNIMDLISDDNNSNNDDNRIYHYTAESILSSKYEQLNSEQNEYNNWKLRDHNSEHSRFRYLSNLEDKVRIITVGDHLKYVKEKIDRIKNEIKQIEVYKNEKEWTVCSFSISQHNTTIKDVIDSSVKHGSIVILEGTTE